MTIFRRLAEAASGLLASIGPSDLTIRHRPGRGTSVRGRLPRAKVPGIVAFFDRDLDPGRPATVRGSWAGRTLRLRFSGGLTPAQRQRTRNFLIEHLR